MQNRRPLLVGHRYGTVVVIAREGTRRRAMLQDIEHRVARSLDRIAVRIHDRSSVAAHVSLANLLAHRPTLAISLRSLYVSV